MLLLTNINKLKYNWNNKYKIYQQNKCIIEITNTFLTYKMSGRGKGKPSQMPSFPGEMFALGKSGK